MATTPFRKFDETVKKILSVPRNELEKREKAWKSKQKRAKKKAGDLSSGRVK
jgi:hypothetical protein